MLLRNFARITLLTALALLASQAHSQSTNDQLKADFENPPSSSRPRVWWHWMNGNITHEGIKLDLEWMHRIGIAGFQSFDASLKTPQVVDHRLIYMTPAWKEAFRYSVHLGDEFKMEMAIAGSPGWSESGGPWVRPSNAMKKYVWSETVISGGAPFHDKLVHPPTVTGQFQSMMATNAMQATPEFYRDASVVAFPFMDSDPAPTKVKITGSWEGLDSEFLNGDDLSRSTNVPVPDAGKESWIQFAFDVPHTIRSVRAAFRWPQPLASLESSDDGVKFNLITDVQTGPAPEETVSFSPVRARYFRVAFRRKEKTPPTLKSFDVAELVLEDRPLVNRFEDKAAFAPTGNLYEASTPNVEAKYTIPVDKVIDLTSRMHADGTLDWTPPPGRWLVLRFGYSLIGTTNHPATAEATGLEVDKLDRRYVRDYFEKYLDSYLDTVGPSEMGEHGIRFVINDSWEAGAQNWTDNMLDQFKKLRGYDLTPWLPVLTGRVVGSAAQSDRLLWDFRKTIADLIATEHYGELEAVLHERHMGHYGESHEALRAFVADGMEVKKYNEIPMSAMWTQFPGVNRPTYVYDADDRESASVAHIYGQNIAAAESMTTSHAAWGWSPATLKPAADEELLNGINRFVIHESAHQPLVGKAPGLSLGQYGQWFNRNETWAEDARPWIDYLARSSFMLQQGHYKADILYFYGEDNNLTELFSDKAPEIPAGYGYDYIDADALEHELHIDKGGEIGTNSGMRYRLLMLDPNSRYMSLPVLRSIARLAQDGATIVGPKPIADPSLADDTAEFQRLVSSSFGDGESLQRVGKGVVYSGVDIRQALKVIGLMPDFEAVGQDIDTPIEFVHRKLESGDIYFLDNRSDHSVTFTGMFRISGFKPEVWRAETADCKQVGFDILNSRTSVSLQLEPWGTNFIVFRKATEELSLQLPPTRYTQLMTIDGPWSISFQEGRGAPEGIQKTNLIDWSQSENIGIRYFSGSANYEKHISVSTSWLKNGQKIWLNLGDVKNLAVVTVNGTTVGEIWHTPYRIDVTSAVRSGDNSISVKIINSWVNRLIGDQQPGAEQYTFTTQKPYEASSPLQPSGLLGPVTLEREVSDFSH